MAEQENTNTADESPKADSVGLSAVLGGLLAQEVFYWATEYEHANNMETMDEYLSNYLPADCEITEQDGTYAEVTQAGIKIGIHASGNGDFRRHKVEFVAI